MPQRHKFPIEEDDCKQRLVPLCARLHVHVRVFAAARMQPHTLPLFSCGLAGCLLRTGSYSLVSDEPFMIIKSMPPQHILTSLSGGLRTAWYEKDSWEGIKNGLPSQGSSRPANGHATLWETIPLTASEVWKTISRRQQSKSQLRDARA